MTDLWTYLKGTDKPIVLYGTGNGADKVLSRLKKDGVEISGIFSSDGFKKNKLFAGVEVTDYASLKAKLSDMIVLVCFGSHLPEVLNNVKKISAENELYMPDVPVSGDEIFDIDFAKKHKDKLKAVYEMLWDEQSKKVFENTVYFKLCGKPQYLYAAESEREEVFELLDLNDNECFLDLGAFNGDTVEEFILHTSGYNSITAVEPDKRNFRKLKENTANIKDITYINSAVSDEIGELHISANHGRGNSADAKKVAVNSTTIDELGKILIPTFIKMDVEGNELKAIDGGKEVFLKHKPKMHVACYHTPYDLFEIPLKIKELVPEYKIYMRHHTCFPAWDINYIFV